MLGEWLTSLTELAKKNRLGYPSPHDKEKVSVNLEKLTRKNVEDVMERVGNFIEGLDVGPEKNRPEDTVSASEGRKLTIVGLVFDLKTGNLEKVGEPIMVVTNQREVIDSHLGRRSALRVLIDWLMSFGGLTNDASK